MLEDTRFLWPETSGRGLGGCGLSLFGTGRDGTGIGWPTYALERERWRAELAYLLGMPYWGQACTTEAARGMAQFGFEELGLHRIYAFAMTKNRASARVRRANVLKRGGGVATNASERLMGLAARCVDELPLVNKRYAFVGGSVGRGDADGWSDVDVTVCVDGGELPRTANLVYEGELVQVDFVSPLPFEEVEHALVDYRFLLESRPVYDPRGEFRDLREDVHRRLGARSGRQKLFEQWRLVVEERKRWANDSIDHRRLHSAAAAGGAAWTDAAFMVMFFGQGTSSTGALIPTMQRLSGIFGDYTRICRWLTISLGDIPERLRAVEHLRAHLRMRSPDRADDFSLSPLQDILNAQKAKRLTAHGELTNLAWQLAGEAFWLYLETANGLSIDDYLATLPSGLGRALETIGLAGLDASAVQELCAMADGLVRMAEQSCFRGV